MVDYRGVVEIRVLGPVEVVSDDGPIRFSRLQQRLILGVLALQVNTPVSAERLARSIWGDGARPTATLHTRISELRKSLLAAGGDTAGVRIDRGPDGYVLQAPPDLIDANRFRAAVADADRAGSDDEARCLLRAALMLWRGPILGQLAMQDDLDGVTASLTSARLTAYEELFAIELRVGNERRVLEELVEISEANPTRERLVTMRLRALQRAGRTSEALLYYHRWRRWLADELGVDPSLEVQAGYAALLSSESDMNVAAVFEVATPRTLPPEPSGFTGRRDEIERMLGALSSSRAVAVSGRGGIGKTSLTLHVAHRLRAEFPDGQLFVDLRGGSDDRLTPGDVLGRFLRALGVYGPALPDDLDQRVDLYRSLLAGRRILVVLDNAAAVAQMLPLIPASPECAVIVNSRARLDAALGMDSVDLNTLSTSQAVAMLAITAGTDRIDGEPESSALLAELCGYVPLALRITAARLLAKPHWRVSTLVDLLRDEQHRLDHLRHEQHDVRASIMLSYAALSEPAQSLIRFLGNAGIHETTAWLASALLDTTNDVARNLLEELFDARLLDAVSADDGPLTRYRLHDLVYLFGADRAAAVDNPSQLRAARQRMYRAMLTATNVAYAAIWGSADYANIRGTTEPWPLDSAVVVAVQRAAVAWFEVERSAVGQTVRRAVADGFVETGWELASTACNLFEALRDYDMLVDLLDFVHDAASDHGDLRGQAAMLFCKSHIAVDQTRYADGDRSYRDAAAMFEQIGDDHGLALTLAWHGNLMRQQTGAEATASLERVLELDAADPPSRAIAWRAIGQIRMDAGDLDGAQHAMETGLRIAITSDVKTSEAQVRFWYGMLRLKQHRIDEAERSFELALALCQVIGDRTGYALCLNGLGLAQLAAGERIRAKATLGTALRLVTQPWPTHLEAFVRRTLKSALGPAT
jgi:DNA-binding SARP family transcriptional activator/Tfp pilus assembly protein PilF